MLLAEKKMEDRGKNERLGHFGGTSRKEPC